jgi:hypothetical protein
MTVRFFPVLLLIALFLLLLGPVPGQTGTFTVRGTGYPPIKAANKAQALLMAKRAALLDGYAAVLRSRQTTPAGGLPDEQFFYEDLAGFIRSVEVVKQTYYADGKVEVVLAGKDETIKHTPLSVQKKQDKPVQPGSMRPVQIDPPKEVSRQQWLAIIEKMVAFSGQ